VKHKLLSKNDVNGTISRLFKIWPSSSFYQLFPPFSSEFLDEIYLIWLNNSGERTASALENYLTSLEHKIEALLSAVEGAEGANSVSSKPNGHSDTHESAERVTQLEDQLPEKPSNTRSR